MPTYELELTDGRKVQFDWEGQGNPSNEVYQSVIDSVMKPGAITQAPPKWVEPVRTGASLAGMLGGAAIGAPAGPAGQVAGAGLLGTGAKQMTDWLLGQAGVIKPKTPMGTMKEIATDIPSMAAAEATGQSLGPLMSLIGKGLSHPWGAYSGMGAKGVQEAYASGMKGTEGGFMKFARKQGSIPELTETAGGGLERLVESRAATYESALANLKGVQGLSQNEVSNVLDKAIKKYGFKEVGKDRWYHGGPSGIDEFGEGWATRIKSEAERYAKEHGGKVYEIDPKDVIQATQKDLPAGVYGNAENVGFIKSGAKPIQSQSNLDWTNTEWQTNPIAQKEIQTAIDTVRGWSDYSALGIDKLKRAMGNLLRQSQPEASGFVAKLKGDLRDMLLNKVPEYGQLVKPYEESTQLINEIRKDFSMGNRNSMEQGLQKLIRAMRNDDQLRTELLSVISANANQPLEPMLAGMLAQSWIPTSLAGRMGGMYEIIRGTANFDPHMALALASSSPRISAEFLHVLGKVGPKAQGAVRYLPQTGLAMAQPSAEPPEFLKKYMKPKEQPQQQ